MSDKRIEEIKSKINSGFYNSDVVMEIVARAILKELITKKV
jgi:anti-sigma28 factor (negative regulator of flagellin synthesis)